MNETANITYSQEIPTFVQDEYALATSVYLGTITELYLSEIELCLTENVMNEILSA